MEPTDPSHQLNLGNLCTRLRRGDAATEAFRAALELAEAAVDRDPSASNYFLLSVACDRTGHLERALTSIRQAVELAPENRQYQQLFQLLQKRYSE